MSGESEGVKICHFSDLHLSLDRPPKIWQLLGKRALGYANLRFNRGRTHSIEPFKALLAHVAKQNPDLVVITGDLTSLALKTEFEAVDRLFREAGLQHDKVLVVPGNHDRYTPFADYGHAFENTMGPWLPTPPSGKLDFPQVRIIGPVLAIGLDTAIWRGPVRAAGRITQRQIGDLTEILSRPEHKEKWPVIAMHHPPFHLRKSGLRDYRNGLEGMDAFIAAFKQTPGTVLHGHLHKVSRRQLEKLDIIGVPSASKNSRRLESQLAYNNYTFGPNGLNKAELVRHWPKESSVAKQFERVELLAEAIVS